MITVKVKGDKEAMKKVQKLIKANGNLKEAFDQVADSLIQEFKANFSQQGGVLNSPWAKRKKEYAWPLLMRTGALQSAWKKKAESKKLTIENTADYAKYQHFGMRPQTGARKLVGFTPVIIKLIKDRIVAYIKRAIAS